MRSKVEELHKKYAQLNDFSDWENLIDLFTNDAILVRPSTPDKPIFGKETLLKTFKNRPKNKKRKHIISDSQIIKKDGDHIEAKCITILIEHVCELNYQIQIGCFLDTILNENGRLLFKKRLGLSFGSPLACNLHGLEIADGNINFPLTTG